jgi:hypothetical protein
MRALDIDREGCLERSDIVRKIMQMQH